MIREKLRVRRLDNGLELLMIERPGAPLVSCRLYVAAGGRYDEGQGGRAHLTEHCLGAGATVGGQQVELALEGIGAQLEATTHREYMHFGAAGLPADLPLIFGALARVVAHPEISAGLVERQQAIIWHEVQQYRDGLAPLWDELFSALWQEHPFLQPAVGSEALWQLGPDALMAHWRRYLRPERSALALVGAFEPERAQAIAEEQLGGWPRSTSPIAATAPPVARQRPAWKQISAELKHAYFMIGWPVPPAGSEHDDALALLTRLIAGGPDALLTRQLREADAELYDVQALLLQYGDSGTLVVSGSCAPERAQAVTARIVELLAGQRLAISDEQRARSQVGYRAALARDYETAHERARLLGMNGLWGVSRPLQRRLEAVTALRTEDLLHAAERLLRGVVPAITVLGGRAGARSR